MEETLLEDLEDLEPTRTDSWTMFCIECSMSNVQWAFRTLSFPKLSRRLIDNSIRHHESWSMIPFVTLEQRLDWEIASELQNWSSNRVISNEFGNWEISFTENASSLAAYGVHLRRSMSANDFEISTTIELFICMIICMKIQMNIQIFLVISTQNSSDFANSWE